MNKKEIIFAERERIIDALYANESQCMFCHRRKCGHEGNRTLPTILRRDGVLRAINLDNYFGTDIES